MVSIETHGGRSAGELYLERTPRGTIIVARPYPCMAFDLHPILEAGDSPRPNQWYVVSPEDGDSYPGLCQRVGACANFVADEGGIGRVLVSAGAAPEGLCSDIHELLITKGAE